MTTLSNQLQLTNEEFQILQKINRNLPHDVDCTHLSKIRREILLYIHESMSTTSSVLFIANALLFLNIDDEFLERTYKRDTFQRHLIEFLVYTEIMKKHGVEIENLNQRTPRAQLSEIIAALDKTYNLHSGNFYDYVEYANCHAINKLSQFDDYVDAALYLTLCTLHSEKHNLNEIVRHLSVFIHDEICARVLIRDIFACSLTNDKQFVIAAIEYEYVTRYQEQELRDAIRQFTSEIVDAILDGEQQ